MMLPIAIDLSRVPVALIGRGERAARRLGLLEADGVARVRVFSDAPERALREAAGTCLIARLPAPTDLADIKVVFIVDYAPDEVSAIVAAAKSAGALINVEDQRDWCEFHTPAVVRRGDLVLSVSTNGKSPAAASAIRAFLERVFPPDWAERLERLARLRTGLRAQGIDGGTVARASADAIRRAGWLPSFANESAPRDDWSGGGSAPAPLLGSRRIDTAA